MRRFALALAALPMLLAAGAVPAGAAASPAHVRVVYMSPDNRLGDVDFYVDGRRALTKAAYDNYSPYTSVASGQHSFAIRKTGAAASSTPEVQVDQSLAAGYFSLFVGGKVGDSRCPVKGVIFSDEVNSPGAGKVSARFVHMAPEVPGVDVVNADANPRQVIFGNVSCFEASSYATLPAGTYHVALQAAGSSNQLFGPVDATMPAAGVVWTLVGIGGVDHPVQLAQIPDAASAGVAPVGAAATGEGGLALGGLIPLGLIAGSLVACALLLLAARRSPA
jgi:hypothetical protein